MEQRRHREWLIPLGVFALIVGISLATHLIQKSVRAANIEARVSELRKANALRVREFFKERRRSSTMMVLHLRRSTKADVREAYRREAAVFLASYQGLQAVNFINPEGTIEIVTPDNAGNQSAKGKRLLERADLAPLLREAKKHDDIRFSPVLSLYQGGKGYAAYVPIWNKGKEFLGWLNIVYRFEDAFTECFSEFPPEMLGLRFSVKGSEEPLFEFWPEGLEMPASAEENETEGGVEWIEFAGQVWRMEAIATPDLIDGDQGFMSELLLWIGILVALFLACVMRAAMIRGRRAHEARREFEAIFNNAPISLFVKDLEGRYTFENAAARGERSEATDTLLGRTDHEILSKDRADTIREMDLATLAGGKPMTFDTEFFNRGEMRHFHTIRFPLLGNAGNARGLCVIGVEVTEERRLLRRVQESEERYRRLYNSTPVMMHSVDAELRVVSVSEYWLASMGYTREEVLGRTSTDFLSPASHAHARDEVIPTLMREGSIKEAAFELVRKDGSKFDGSLSAVVERNQNGEIERLTAVIVDVTKRNHAESELALLAKELEQRVKERTASLENIVDELRAFTYSVSHDLRAPLRAISGFADILREDHSEGLAEEGHDALARITRNVVSMQGLIDSLLKLSRISGVDLNPRPFDLSALVHEVTEALLASDYRDHRAQIDIQEGVRCVGDPGLIRVMMFNLIDNALKYSIDAHQPEIRFEYREEEGVGVYSLSDKGVGFDATRAKEMLQPFKRLHHQDFDGSGIGLAIVQRVIQRHGGWIRAESPGHIGATMSFTLDAGVVNGRNT